MAREREMKAAASPDWPYAHENINVAINEGGRTFFFMRAIVEMNNSDPRLSRKLILEL